MKTWIVGKATTADAIIAAIEAGKCTSDWQIERIARQHNDKVMWCAMPMPTPEKPTLPQRKQTVDAILQELGVPCSLSGYGYLTDAITTVAENGAKPCNITQYLYPGVAQRHGTTQSRVERAIRHAIETAFNRSDPDTLEKYFGNTISAHKGKLTNSEFIYAAARHLLRPAS